MIACLRIPPSLQIVSVDDFGDRSSIGNGMERCPILVGPDGIFYSALWERDMFDCG